MATIIAETTEAAATTISFEEVAFDLGLSGRLILEMFAGKDAKAGGEGGGGGDG